MGDALNQARDLEGDGHAKFDLDVGVMADMKMVRLGLTSRNLTDPHFEDVAGNVIALGRQTRAGVAFLPTSGLTLAMDVDLNTVDLRDGLRRMIALGGESRLGKTFWQSVDAGVVSGVAATGLKYAFSRERPSQTDDPNRWFTGNGQSFPSGEVTTVSSLVTPFVLEYRHDNPAVYALELLPVYDSIARVKTWGHWQTDVIAGFALGTTAGFLFHQRSSPLIWGIMPHGIQVGIKMRF